MVHDRPEASHGSVRLTLKPSLLPPLALVISCSMMSPSAKASTTRSRPLSSNAWMRATSSRKGSSTLHIALGAGGSTRRVRPPRSAVEAITDGCKGLGDQ